MVAVTGHRDIVAAEVEPIRARVKSLFVELQHRYPDNQLTIMSPLAEGADLLVAQVAVELSLNLVVPLPKSKADYLRDFRTEQARQQFQSLYGKATEVFELTNNKPPAPEGIEQSVWDSDYPYAQLGAFLSAHCHILLAIWDGKPSHHLGGTAQVVKFHHDDVMPGITPKTTTTQQMLVDDESDLVFHIVCSRDRDDFEPHPDHPPLDWCWYTKDEQTPRAKELPAQHELIFKRSTDFSADAARHASKISNQRSTLLEGHDNTELPAGIETIDHFFSIADCLAIHYQRNTLRTLGITHLLAFLMGLMFILYSDFQSWQYYLWAFLGLFAAAAGLQLLSKRRGWHRKYLDYRTLAEGLRVQFYWAAAGVMSENKWKYPHDSYLQSQDPEFGWIRNVMRVAGTRCDAAPSQQPAGLAFALRQWIGDSEEGQLGYFRKKAHDRIKRHKLTEGMGLLSLATSVLIVFVFLLFGSQLSDTVADILTVVMGATLLLFAVRQGYAYATAEKELIKQYEYMLGIYDNADRRIHQAADDMEKRQVLAALGQSALNEHADWILMHRERSLDEGEIWRMGS